MKGFRDQMLQTFLAEARDLVRDLDEGLRQLSDGDTSAELVGRLFRAAHSIKGSGGMFGLDALVTFTHVVENLLDRVRSGSLAPNEALVSDLQDSCDHIADLIEVLVAQSGTLDATGLERDAQLRRALGRHEAAPTAIHAPASEALTDAPAVASGQGGASGTANTGCWHVSVRFGVDVYRQGINPLSFVRELEEIGEIEHLTTVYDQMPSAADMDPESCYLGFEISLRTAADRTRIASVFEFVEDSSQVRILPPHSKIAEFVELIQQLPEPDARLGEILIGAGTITRAELEAGLQLQQTRTGTDGTQPPLGEMLVEHASLAPEVVQAALEKQQKIRNATTVQDAAFVRVRADKLDELINLVGELVIAGAGASLLAERTGDATLRESHALVSRLMEDIRERSLRLRMVPIGETFSRFHRVVREISRDLGKDIELVIEGADTELDKSVVEKLADPLVHLVRNAADHGIESAQARIAAGKPARGQLRLSAAHQSGHIIIEITDDGAGLNRDRILAKARERGLVAPGVQPDDHDILQLIFEPGFSTAAAITNLSGRGVGMDVVRRNITALRGDIEIVSPPGQGTTVRIRLPLTLAIIEGFLVGVGDAAFVIPLDRVVECIEMPADRAGVTGYLDLRGHPLPLLRIRDQLQVRGASRTRRENVVVVDCGDHQAGFVVDALLGEFQTVIKPLGPLFSGLKGISGSTILGSGEVALILDVPELAQAAIRGELQYSDRQCRTPVASAVTTVS